MRAHTFHIPVMGIAFTIDSPIKVAQFGISSVVSLVDDILVEKMREFYCQKFDLPFHAISNKIEDFRAKRITAYLDMMDDVVNEKFSNLKKSFAEKGGDFEKYMEMLPDFSELKQKFNQMSSEEFNKTEAWEWVKNHLTPGSIDVNIMTKLDKANWNKKEKLDAKYNDAHAALRGFANSKLSSSIVLSAGLNARLYSYFEQFSDFFPSKKNELKKKIILKVSDYRSAMIQGKVFAKKGLWVSEYRIESGLNCGGHAFATDGFLMGPILEEFKNKRETLINSLYKIYADALNAKGKHVPEQPLPVKITAQGGVGTGEEHQLLTDYYNVDSVGWGTPFLLCDEATTVDTHTRDLLSDAKKEDLYLSEISPLGVPFNSLRGNTKDIQKMEFVAKGRPGSSCPKQYLVSNTEYTEKPICVASRQYQHLKIKELDETTGRHNGYKKVFDKIVDKSCICVGLGTAALMENNLDMRTEGEGVSVCPGPNMAYFSKKSSLKEMVGHIYNRSNLVTDHNRPNMFINELEMYIDYLKKKIDGTTAPIADKQRKYFESFKSNLAEGVNYYSETFAPFLEKFGRSKEQFLEQLEDLKQRLERVEIKQKEPEPVA